MPSFAEIPENPIDGRLSVAVIGPDDQRRQAVVAALAAWQGPPPGDARLHAVASGVTVREMCVYPANLDELPQLLERHYDAVLVELDSNPDYAFDIVERICDFGTTSVMVYSSVADLKLAIRFMRAGAREFLTLPLDQGDLDGALERVSVRGLAAPGPRRAAKRLLVFVGAKGSCGVTTVAANFAAAIAQETSQSTLLIDLGQPLGDAAINLGMVPTYSTDSAFQDPSRLDASFLATLVSRHESGLSVLAAPNEFPDHEPGRDAIDKLLAVARQSFDYVVVDAGARTDLRHTALFGDFATIYLIAQVGVTELRNANRMVTQFFSHRRNDLQIVLNRYRPHALLFDEEHIGKALTRPAQWRIPDDYAHARRTEQTAIAIALEDSPISAAIRQMARTACGLPTEPERKKSFSLFGRDFWSFPKILRSSRKPVKAPTDSCLPAAPARSRARIFHRLTVLRADLTAIRGGLSPVLRAPRTPFFGNHRMQNCLMKPHVQPITPLSAEKALTERDRNEQESRWKSFTQAGPGCLCNGSGSGARFTRHPGHPRPGGRRSRRQTARATQLPRNRQAHEDRRPGED